MAYSRNYMAICRWQADVIRLILKDRNSCRVDPMRSVNLFKHPGIRPANTSDKEWRAPGLERSGSKGPAADPSAGRWLALPRHVAHVAAAIDLWLEKRKQLRELRELTDEQLSDIGLSRRDAQQVSAGAFWDYEKPHP